MTAGTERYAFDRTTNIMTTGSNANIDGEPITDAMIAGDAIMPLKLPFFVDKNATYNYFDTSLLKGYPLSFVEETQIDGLTVYKFECKIEPTQIGEQEGIGEKVGGAADFVAPRFYANDARHLRRASHRPGRRRLRGPAADVPRPRQHRQDHDHQGEDRFHAREQGLRGRGRQGQLRQARPRREHDPGRVRRRRPGAAGDRHPAGPSSRGRRRLSGRGRRTRARPSRSGPRAVRGLGRWRGRRPRRGTSASTPERRASSPRARPTSG